MSIRNPARHLLRATAACLMLCVTANAQERIIPWPSTFAGQPDFDFSRQELIDELRKEQRDNTPADEEVPPLELPASWQLLYSSNIIDPFANQRINRQLRDGETAAQSAANNEANAPAQPIDINQMSELFGRDLSAELPSSPNLLSAALPRFNETEVNLSEFRDFIDNLISREMSRQQANLQDTDFQPYINNLTIQSIVTSPYKYVLINNRRYTVGDRFLLPVESTIDAGSIEDRVNNFIPPAETVSEDVYAQYISIRDAALQTLAERLNTPSINTESYKVSVTIREIERQKVIVSVLGKEYELKMRFRL